MKSANLDQLAMDAINENIELADIAINTPRAQNNDSCYGNAALLLLASVLDAIGSYYNHKDSKGHFVSFNSKPNIEERDGGKEHFKQVYDNYICNMKDNCGYTSQDMFIKDFYKNFRCGVTHNAVFSDGKLAMHTNTDSSNKILNVNDLLNMVKTVRDDFFNKHKSDFTFVDNKVEPETGYTINNQFQN